MKTYDVAYRNGSLPSAYNPTSRAGRTHSIPYCVATALLKPIHYEDFDAQRAADADLNDLIQRVQVINDSALTQAYPAKSKCIIDIILNDGTTLHGERDYPKGDPADPLSDNDIEDKFKTYFFFSTNQSETKSIIDTVWHLENQSSIDWLVNPLKRSLI